MKRILTFAILFTLSLSLIGMEERQPDEQLPIGFKEICESIRICSCPETFNNHFNNHNELLQHLLDKHLSGNIFVCKKEGCRFETYSPEMLILHFPKHTEETINVCNACKLTNPGLIKVHRESHKRFSKEFAFLMKDDKRIIRDKDGNLICPKCNLEYKVLKPFLKHINREIEMDEIDEESSDYINCESDNIIFYIKITPKKITSIDPLPQETQSCISPKTSRKRRNQIIHKPVNDHTDLSMPLTDNYEMHLEEESSPTHEPELNLTEFLPTAILQSNLANLNIQQQEAQLHFSSSLVSENNTRQLTNESIDDHTDLSMPLADNHEKHPDQQLLPSDEPAFNPTEFLSLPIAQLNDSAQINIQQSENIQSSENHEKTKSPQKKRRISNRGKLPGQPTQYQVLKLKELPINQSMNSAVKQFNSAFNNASLPLIRLQEAIKRKREQDKKWNQDQGNHNI